MPLYNEEQKRFIVKETGYDPELYDYDEDRDIIVRKVSKASPSESTVQTDDKVEAPKSVEPLGTGATALATFGESIVPSVASGLGMAGVSKLIGNKLLASRNKFGIAGGIGLNILGGLLAGRAAGAVQEKALETIAPEALETLRVSQAENPLSATLGGLAATPLAGVNPSVVNVAKAAGTTYKMIRAPKMPLDAKEIANLSNVAGGAGIGTGIDWLNAGINEHSLDPDNFDLLTSLGVNTVFNRPNAIGKRFYGFIDPADMITEPNSSFLAKAAPKEDKVEVGEIIAPKGQFKDNQELWNTMAAIREMSENAPLDYETKDIKALKTRKRKKSEEPITQDEGNARTIIQKEAIEEAELEDRPVIATPAWNQFFDALGKRRNVKIVDDPNLTTHAGDVDTRIGNEEVTARISETKGGADTRPHEISHPFQQDKARSSRPQDVDSISKLNAITELDPDYQDWRDKRNKEGEASTVEEYNATNLGTEAIRRAWRNAPDNSTRRKIELWWNDIQNHLDVRKGKATYDQALKNFYYEMLHDPDYVKVFGESATKGLNAATASAVVDKTVDTKPINEFEAKATKEFFGPRKPEKPDTRFNVPNYPEDGANLLREKGSPEYNKNDIVKLFKDNGKNITREEAADYANAAFGDEWKPRNTKRSDEGLFPNDNEDDVNLYNELTSSFKAEKDIGRKMELWKNIEAIKNKYGGKMPEIKPPKNSTESLFDDNEVKASSAFARMRAAIDNSEIAKQADNEVMLDAVADINTAFDKRAGYKPEEDVKDSNPFISSKFSDKSLFENSNDQSKYRDSFYLESIRHLESDGNNKPIDANQLINTIRNKFPSEWDLLEESGIREAFPAGSKVSGNELAKWINENGPRVEVKKLDANYSKDNNPRENPRYYELQHEVYDNLTEQQKELYSIQLDKIVNKIDITGEALTENEINKFKAKFINSGLDKSTTDKLYEYLDLDLKREGVEDDAGIMNNGNDSATRAYQQVNPKPLDQMPGAVDLLVRIPIKEHLKDSEFGRPKYKSQHYPQSGDNLLVHVRGYEEILPNGKKVFHAFEIQSDWGQNVREQKEYIDKTKVEISGINIADPNKVAIDFIAPDGQKWNLRYWGDVQRNNVDKNSIQNELVKFKKLLHSHDSRLGGNKDNNDPLLKDYNRLAIKAAIKHAKDIGADYIAISDAETAMMTEGHDKAADMVKVLDIDDVYKMRYGDGYAYTSKEMRESNLNATKDFVKHEQLKFAEKVKEGKYVQITKGNGKKMVLRVDQPEDRMNGAFKALAKEVQAYAVEEKDGTYIPQEQGMRFNYDNTLQKIAEDLTGTKGERVSFGEHKNARSGVQFHEGDRVENLYRENLIFKNADGTPKTDITALMYPIKDTTKNEFTLTRKKYSDKSLFQNKQTETPEFKKWFGDSKVVDSEGKPLVVYHGGNFDFLNAKPNKAIFKNGNSGFNAPDRKIGFFFTPNKNYANVYSEMSFGQSTLDKPLDPIETYVSIKNPLYKTHEEWNKIKDWGSLPNQLYKNNTQSVKAFKQIKDDAIANGHDGIIIGKGTESEEIVAFYPEQIKSAIGNTGAFDSKNPDIRYSTHSFLANRKAQIDRVRDIKHKDADKVATAFEDFYRAQDNYKGIFAYVGTDKLIDNLSWNPKERFIQDNEAYRRTVDYLDEMMDKGSSNIKPDPTALKIIQDVNAETLKHKGVSLNVPDLKGHKYYLAQIPSRHVLDVILNNPQSAEARQLHRDWFDYYDKILGKTREDALKALKIFKAGYDKQQTDLASQYGPIDKAAGVGIPSSWREKNLIDRIGRFSNRYARRLAYIDTIEHNKVVQNALNDELEGIGKSDIVKSVMFDIQGQRDIKEANREAVAGLVKAAWMGTLTGTKDFTSNLFLGMQHQTLDQAIVSPLKAWQHIKQNLEESFKAGVNRKNVGSLEFLGDDDIINNFFNLVRRGRDVMNTASGRNHLERITRATAFGQAKWLAQDNIWRAHKNRLNSQSEKFLNDFVPDWKKYVSSGKLPPEVLQRAATDYVGSVQGTYDYRGLPEISTRGSLAPYLSLSRWSIEKLNNFEKHVVKPATKGNFRPLLNQTIGLVIGGAAVNKIVELMTGRKEKAPKLEELKEIQESEGTAKTILPLTYKLAAYASLSGYAGMYGDVAKMMMDWKFKNRGQTLNNPLLEGADTLLRNISDYLEAMENDGFSLESVVQFIEQNLEDYFQVWRIVKAQLDPEQKKEIAESNEMRDLKLYRNTHDEEVNSPINERANPFRDKKLKEFRKEEDIEKIAPQAQALIENAFKKADGDIYKLRKEFRKMKYNADRTMPSFDDTPDSFMKYVLYLEKTQGRDEAVRRMTEYFKTKEINKIKSAIIPSIK